MHGVFGINTPMTLPSARFLASDSGRFVDLGAGSGRAAIGVLQARPHTTATAIDIYSDFYGIVGNTPARLLTNARIGGVADRIEVQTADMRKLPFPDSSYDAAVSTYAIDHLRRDDIPVALNEVARVLKPNGEFLLGIVNQDVWVRFSMPIPHFGLAAHRPADPNRWRALLQGSGFEVLEEGTSPATLYWVTRKGTGPRAPDSETPSTRNGSLSSLRAGRIPSPGSSSE
jgi:SAM-dependent methyltransferase